MARVLSKAPKQTPGIGITPLDEWISVITKGDLQEYQLAMLNATLETAQKGRYYAQRGYPRELRELSQLSKLPTIDAQTIQSIGSGLICAPLGEVSRIVTLRTSGSTGSPKRLFFSEEDLELTLDYFANGLTAVACPGEAMMILLPCERRGGVGDLIARALERIPVRPVRFGPIGDLRECASALSKESAAALVGAPVQILALARYCEAKKVDTKVRSALLCTDNVPEAVKHELARIWDCEVYEHYGSTEMGLGGAIDCDAHCGLHIRENDLLFEVVDEQGTPVPDGVSGEVVFTTLTRRAMPLIRYKTGDVSRIVEGRCACGSDLKRLAATEGRLAGTVTMACGARLSIRELDEALLGLRAVCDYDITTAPADDHVVIEIHTQRSIGDIRPAPVAEALRSACLPESIKATINVTVLPDALPRREGKRKIFLQEAIIC